MPYFTFTASQKAQLVGWINHEKDHLLSMYAMAKCVVIPSISGSIELIQTDLSFVSSLRDTIKQSEGETIELSVEEVETLAECAKKNKWENRADFWVSVKESLEG